MNQVQSILLKTDTHEKVYKSRFLSFILLFIPDVTGFLKIIIRVLK